MLPPPPPADTLQVVHVSSLVSALVKLNVNVSIENLIKVIHDEDEARRVKTIAEATRRRAALSTLALQPTQATVGLKFTTISKFVPKPPKPTVVDPLAKQRRRRLLELTEEAFPDGKFPDPFISTWLSLSEDSAANRLPFILATRIVVTSATDMSDDPPQFIFENVWCLWDTGAQASYIATSQLDANVRNNKIEGNALMDINFSNVNQTIGSIIHFRPHLPNGVTFIILGQHALLNRLQYQVQPVSINSQLSRDFPEAYGQIDLVTWSDPALDELVTL